MHTTTIRALLLSSHDHAPSPRGPHGRARRPGPRLAASLLLVLTGCDADDLGESGASEGASESSGGAEVEEDELGLGAGAGGLRGGPEFTTDGCFMWSGQTPLASAVDDYPCVEVQAGTFVLTAGIALKPGHTLRGVSAAQSILKAATTWKFGCCDAMVNDKQPGVPGQQPFKVEQLTLDGSGVATYNVCCRDYVLEDSVVMNSRCSAIGAAGTGVTARRNTMLNSGQPTYVAGKQVSCATGNHGGVAEGAAIYSQASGTNLGTIIEDNQIHHSYGPALDVNGAWSGVFRNNVVSDNRAWAAVSLYGASNWIIEDNLISHPADQPPQPYHPHCATGPVGGRSAGIFLCQDTDANNLVTLGNQILNNKTSSFYGILSVGADELKPYWAPRNNTFAGNDVYGSHFGCADDFAPGQWFADKNTWTGNHSAGTSVAPTHF